MAEQDTRALSVIVIGASGDLARKKIFPALFALWCQKCFPESARFYGFARTEMDDGEFREKLRENLTCRYQPEHDCPRMMSEFLDRCHYEPGQYGETDDYLRLYQRLRTGEGEQGVNRLFYMATPPFVFMDVARALGDSGLTNCGVQGAGWSRVVIEKPFGHDRTSSDELVEKTSRIFTEPQTYRIDHYLGKEVIQNLLALRFANRIFEPVWNREHIESVHIRFREDQGVEGRGGYFDGYGIIRDTMQNHLLQILALTAMERPDELTPRVIRDQKVEVLKHVGAPSAEDFVLGQFEGYREYEDVPDASRTPTFAQVPLFVDNERWRGVPFVMSAGKGMAEKITEIRVHFRAVESNPFAGEDCECTQNELVIRVQPDEGIMLRIQTKQPGWGMRLVGRDLDLRYASAFETVVPEAYESLLLDVYRGEKSLFIRKDELAASWDVFTPALREMEKEKAEPEIYSFGVEELDEARRQSEGLRDRGEDV